jgi:uncharacterized membrane protein YqaE (UPF0057 family)
MPLEGRFVSGIEIIISWLRGFAPKSFVADSPECGPERASLQASPFEILQTETLSCLVFSLASPLLASTCELRSTLLVVTSDQEVTYGLHCYRSDNDHLGCRLAALGIFLEVGLTGQFWLNILLTLLGNIPGIIHALYIILKHSPQSQLHFFKKCI